MKTFLLSTILLLSLVSSMKLTLEDNDDKVHIDLFYESLCPDCQKFIQGSVKKALATPDIWKIADFILYPYGNAKTAQNGSSWAITCQHGVRECEGNVIEACAI